MRWVAGVRRDPLGGVRGGTGAEAHLSEEMEDRFTDSHEISEARRSPGWERAASVPLELENLFSQSGHLTPVF